MILPGIIQNKEFRTNSKAPASGGTSRALESEPTGNLELVCQNSKAPASGWTSGGSKDLKAGKLESDRAVIPENDEEYIQMHAGHKRSISWAIKYYNDGHDVIYRRNRTLRYREKLKAGKMNTCEEDMNYDKQAYKFCAAGNDFDYETFTFMDDDGQI